MKLTLDIDATAKMLAAYFRDIEEQSKSINKKFRSNQSYSSAKKTSSNVKKGFENLPAIIFSEKVDGCLCVHPGNCVRLTCAIVWKWLLTHPDKLEHALLLQRDAADYSYREGSNRGYYGGEDAWEGKEEHLPKEAKVLRELAEIYRGRKKQE